MGCWEVTNFLHRPSTNLQKLNYFFNFILMDEDKKIQGNIWDAGKC